MCSWPGLPFRVPVVPESVTRALTQGIFGTAVLAISGSTGTALDVRGRAKFSTVGSGTIPAGQDSVHVSTRPGEVSPNSHITVTLTGNPGPVLSGMPPVVWWIERQPAVAFVIHLTRKVGQATPFTYLITEPS